MKAKTDYLVEQLNRCFGFPFLPKGFFEAKVGLNGNGLKITIGDRDLEITGGGKLLGSGSNVGLGRKWKIVELEI